MNKSHRHGIKSMGKQSKALNRQCYGGSTRHFIYLCPSDIFIRMIKSMSVLSRNKWMNCCYQSMFAIRVVWNIPVSDVTLFSDLITMYSLHLTWFYFLRRQPPILWCTVNFRWWCWRMCSQLLLNNCLQLLRNEFGWESNEEMCIKGLKS